MSVYLVDLTSHLMTIFVEPPITVSVLPPSKPEGKTSMDGPNLDCNLARSSPSLNNQSGVGKSCSQLPLAGDRPRLRRRPDKVDVVFSNVLAFSSGISI
jgi:hypothetical protein